MIRNIYSYMLLFMLMSTAVIKAQSRRINRNPRGIRSRQVAAPNISAFKEATASEETPLTSAQLSVLTAEELRSFFAIQDSKIKEQAQKILAN